MFITTDYIIKFGSRFIEKRGIEDEDIKQEIYLYLMQEVGKPLSYPSIYSKCKRIVSKCNAEKNNRNELISLENIAYTMDFDYIGLKYDVERVLFSSNLTFGDKFTLIHSFGLCNVDSKTLREIGRIYPSKKLSHSRIRDIQFRALRKIRHPARNKIIIDYYLN